MPLRQIAGIHAREFDELGSRPVAVLVPSVAQVRDNESQYRHVVLLLGRVSFRASVYHKIAHIVKTGPDIA